MPTTAINPNSINPDSINLISPGWWQQFPLESFAWMRSQPGMFRCPTSGFWAVARHGDLLAVERDADTFSSDRKYRVVPGETEVTMISQDDPGHLAQRRMINRRFTPRAVRSHGQEYTTMIGAMVDTFISEAAANGSVEVVEMLAAQLPCRITAKLIGFGEERWREVQSWSERQMRIDTHDTDETVENDLLASIMEWAMVMQELLPQRAAQPEEDLFSDWLAGGMAPETMVQETGLMIAGGAETTRTVIAHGLHAFAQYPDQWELLADQPKLIPLAVDEMIRWVTPLNNMFRVATVDAMVGSQQVSAGDRLALIYPSANRDETVFDEPNRFDVTRDPNPHLAFGYGTHFCLGANLAKLELRLMMEALVPRITNLQVVTEPDIEPNIFARAVRQFDLTFDER